MEEAKFQQVSEDGMAMLTALMSPFVGTNGGRRITYNAYLGDLEVVVVGYQYDLEGGHTNTKPVAILVDSDLFMHLRVDSEVDRTDGDGVVQPPLLKEDV